MPFEPISPVGNFIAGPELPRPSEDVGPAPTTSETFGAAFRTDNTIGSLFASQDAHFAGGRMDENYDPWADIADTPYEPYYENFARAQNKEHAAAIRADIDRENKDRDIMARSGWTGTLASFVAGTVDWPIAIPGGTVVRSAKGGVSLLKTALNTGVAGGIAGAASETMLQNTQQTRTAEESAMVIGGSAVLAGALGPVFGKIFSKADLDGFAPRVERDLTVPGVDQPDPFEPGGFRPSVEAVQGASDKSRAVADAIRETAEEILPRQVRVQVVDSLGPVGGDGLYAARPGQTPEQQRLLTQSAWQPTRETFGQMLEDDLPRGRKHFDGGALAAFDRMTENIAATNKAASEGDAGAARQALGKALADADELDRLAPGARTNLYTQHVRSAARQQGVGADEAMFSLRGFYSPAIRAAEAISMQKGTGEQFLKQITKVPGVRKDELEWMGLEEFLASKKSVTRDEVLAFMQVHQVDLDEKVLGNAITAKKALSPTTAEDVLPKIQWSEDWFEQADKVWSYRIGDEQYYITHGEEGWGIHTADGQVMEGDAANLAQAQHMLDGHHTSFHDDPGMAKFGDYKVPGGKNYRELLIRLPEFGSREATPEEAARLADLGAKSDAMVVEANRAGEATPEYFATLKQINDLSKERSDIMAKAEPKYTSKHFNDQEIVHLRVDDRTGPDGEKVLFINEVQSDLHQAARGFGYGRDGLEKAMALVDAEGYAPAAKSEIDRLHADLRENPDDTPEMRAKFKRLDDLNEEAAKRASAAARYVQSFDKTGAPRAPFEGDLWLELALKRALLYASENGYDAISWARSDQIAKAVGAKPEKLALQYDSKIGKFLDKYTKKWRGKVDSASDIADSGEFKARPNGSNWDIVAPNGEVRATNVSNAGERLRELNAAEPHDTNPILHITPEMRASVMEGQPFSVRQTETGVTAEGRFDPDKLLITIAADALDPAKTLRHESIHALKQMGLFTPKEWATLEAAARKQGWVESNNVRALYEGVYKDRITPELLTEEAIAEQFSLWRQGASGVKGVIAKLFERMQQFLEKTGNALRGRGFQTADDVFTAVRGGDVASRAPGATPAPSVPGMAGLGHGTSVGAAARTRVDDTVKSAYGMEKAMAFMHPTARLQQSVARASKRNVQELAEVPTLYEKNALGEPTAPGGSDMGAPGAVETRIKFWQAPLAEAVQAVDNAFLMYRKGHAKRFPGEAAVLTMKDTVFGTSALDHTQFSNEVAKSLRRGDEHAIPEVAGVARLIRKTVLDPLKDGAIEENMLPEGVKVETALSYLMRMYNKDLIIAERDQFKAIVTNWLEGQESAARGRRARVSELVNRVDKAEDRILAAEERVATAREAGRKFDKNAVKEEVMAAKAEIADLQKAIEKELGPQVKDAGRLPADGEAPKPRGGKATVAAARKMTDELDREPGEIEDLADQVIDRILGTPDGRLPYDADMDVKTVGKMQVTVRGPLAARDFMIPDVAIERWLENDIEKVMRAYVRTMAPDVEITKRFGAVDMKLQMKEIAEDYARLSAQAKTPAARQKLHKQRDNDIADLAAIRDRLRGTYRLPNNPDGLLVRSGRVVRSLNYMRMLGNMTVSALPDLGGTVLAHGIIRTVGDGLVPLLRNWSGARLAMNEVKLSGTALDMVLDSRSMAMNEVMEDFGRHTKFERGVSAMASKFGVVSLMAPWNASLKQFAGIVTQTRMLRAIEKLAAGKIAVRELELLASGGISPANAMKIAAQFAKHGKKDRGVWFANTAEWDERTAIEAFRGALVKEVDRIIVTPGQEKPLWMSTEWGAMVGQFKSFQIASMQRTVIANLQRSDMATLNGIIMMTALGGLSTVLRAKIAGQPMPDLSDNQKKAQFVVEAVDRSGLTGWLMEANAMTEKFSRGAVGLSAITGKPISRYAQRNLTGSMLGPTAGTAEDFARIAGAAASGEWNQTDSRVMRRLVPYNNVFYARKLFDEAEAGINGFLGVPKAAGARR